MFTLILIMTFGLREGVTSQKIPGYETSDACEKAAYIARKDDKAKAFCVPSPSSISSSQG